MRVLGENNNILLKFVTIRAQFLFGSIERIKKKYKNRKARQRSFRISQFKRKFWQ